MARVLTLVSACVRTNFVRSNHVLRPLLWVSALLLFEACTSSPTKVGDSANPRAESPAELSLFFSNQRVLEYEPCGCSFLPLGGLHREHNRVTQWKAKSPNSVVLSMGTTFGPAPADLLGHKTDAQKKNSFKRHVGTADFLAQSLGPLGIQALGLTAEDTYVGIEKLRTYESKTKIPFLSLNLFSKKNKTRLFQPDATFNFEKVKVLVLSVTAVSPKGYPISKDVWVKDPIEAVTERMLVLEKSGESPLIVLLTDLPEFERTKLQSKFPQINLILGGPLDERNATLNQEGAGLVHMNSLARGRGVGRVEFWFGEKRDQFFNPQITGAVQSSGAYWTRRLPEINAALSDKTLDAPSRKELEAKKALFKKKLAWINQLPKQADSQTTYFEAQVALLDKQYEEPKNEFHDRIKAHIEKGRKAALDPH